MSVDGDVDGDEAVGGSDHRHNAMELAPEQMFS